MGRTVRPTVRKLRTGTLKASTVKAGRQTRATRSCTTVLPINGSYVQGCIVRRANGFMGGLPDTAFTRFPVSQGRQSTSAASGTARSAALWPTAGNQEMMPLDAETRTERWQYPMGSYTAAVIHRGCLYVSSRDGYLYALDMHTARLRWKQHFVYPVYQPATITEDVVYINNDGAYALSSATGAVLWHQHLGSSPSVHFTPSVILDGGVYLARTDGHGQSTLYALNASNGTEYWHSHIPSQVAPLSIAE
jgi:outer membrane protein assembly factor BamB